MEPSRHGRDTMGQSLRPVTASISGRPPRWELQRFRHVTICEDGRGAAIAAGFTLGRSQDEAAPSVLCYSV